MPNNFAKQIEAFGDWSDAPIEGEVTLRNMLPKGTQVLWTQQLVSIQGRQPNGAPFAITKQLPITYREIGLLGSALGIEVKF